ncbi:O-acyltransferase like protein [Zeugodacus cucurbitae]|uniref:Nose resistant to fluoxetine protein 6 n=1 Tax=Zeugodacus cucurbitae TaxID=28588 RepID=A0A0A1WFV7_ZEUCU|nr:O-acyltransferase like protein [Zeugodacus cucurbitae]
MSKVKLYQVVVLLKLLSFVCSSGFTVDPNSDQYQLMQRSSIIFGLTVISHPDMVSHSCYTQLQETQKAMLMQQPWAMKMYDASGFRESGFILGNGIWLGSRNTCNAVKTPAKLKISTYIPHRMNTKIMTDTAPFPTDYRVVNLWHNSTWQIDPVYPFYEPCIMIGLCLPSACSIPEIGQLMAIYVEHDLFVSNDIYNMRMRVESVKDFKLRDGFFSRPSTMLFIGFWLMTLLLSVLALRRHMKRNSEMVEVLGNSTKTEKYERTSVLSNTKSQTFTQLSDNGIVDYFNVEKNWELLFPTEGTATGGTEAFPAVNGLRFYGAMGVVFFHLLIISYPASTNKSEIYKLANDVGNFDIFVDLFFTISGFLQTYHFFQDTKTIKRIRHNGLMMNTKVVFMYIMHRLIRLGPLYALVMCLSDVGALIIDDMTVFPISKRINDNCEMYWWRNVLFIQNLFDHHDLCMYWTWSSACDMQFYIFSIILLCIYVKHPKVGKALTLATVVANMIYTFFTGINLNYMFRLETTAVLFTELYMNPLSRVLAYVIGGLAGWFFVQNQQKQLYANFFQNQSLQEFLGYLSIIAFFTCILSSMPEGYSAVSYVILLTIQRIVFSSSVCCLIFANAAGSVKWFFAILENPIFKKFNQITYAMFLLNPLPMALLTSMNNTSRNSGPYNLFIEYIGICVLLYFICTIFTLFFEVPYKNISKMLVQRNKVKIN